MIHRAVTEAILKNLTAFPAANIIGPRQVGKTTLARYLQTRLGKPSIYLDLQDEQDLAKTMMHCWGIRAWAPPGKDT